MTTIATDGVTIAADTLAVDDSGHKTRIANKVRLVERDGRVFAAALSGAVAPFEALIDWYAGGHEPERMPRAAFGYNLALFEAGGRIVFFSKDTPYPEPYAFPFAMGSGRKYAYGAMAAGASPEEAVRVAMRYDASTGGDVEVLELPPELRYAPAIMLHRHNGQNKALQYGNGTAAC